jgi:hypothetical protein
MPSNGEVEGPPRSAQSEPRVHTVFQHPRRHYRLSRPPPTIVRGQALHKPDQDRKRPEEFYRVGYPEASGAECSTFERVTHERCVNRAPGYKRNDASDGYAQMSICTCDYKGERQRHQHDTGRMKGEEPCQFGATVCPKGATPPYRRRLNGYKGDHVHKGKQVQDDEYGCY